MRCLTETSVPTQAAGSCRTISTTPHLISNSTLKSYAHTSELDVLKLTVLPLEAQMTACIISMRDGE
jgi:hypothetical protein